jgi:leucyl-tRNA synthetase
VFESGWPKYDESLAAEDLVTMAVQVNGKTRGTIQVAKTISQEGAMSAVMADESIAKFVTGTPKKVVFVPGRLMNIVV